jgi:hypothetical protein
MKIIFSFSLVIIFIANYKTKSYGTRECVAIRQMGLASKNVPVASNLLQPFKRWFLKVGAN